MFGRFIMGSPLIEYRAQMLELWDTQVYLTRESVIAASLGNPNAQNAQDALYKVTDRIGCNFGEKYGEKSGKQYGCLLKKHVGFIINFVENLLHNVDPRKTMEKYQRTST